MWVDSVFVCVHAISVANNAVCSSSLVVVVVVVCVCVCVCACVRARMRACAGMRASFQAASISRERHWVA